MYKNGPHLQYILKFSIRTFMDNFIRRTIFNRTDYPPVILGYQKTSVFPITSQILVKESSLILYFFQ